MVNKKLKKRIVEIAYKHKLSHLGSYFSCIDPMDHIFEKLMNKDDIFILSNGHASIAFYTILEKYYGHNAEELFLKHGGHPHLDENNHIYCSSGSLGMGLAVAVGRALANRNRTVHVMISDGECAEGVIWESLRVIVDQNIYNIKVYVIANGYGAYDPIPEHLLRKRLSGFDNEFITIIPSTSECFPFLHGLNAHYHIMKEEDYDVATDILK